MGTRDPLEGLSMSCLVPDHALDSIAVVLFIGFYAQYAMVRPVINELSVAFVNHSHVSIKIRQSMLSVVCPYPI